MSLYSPYILFPLALGVLALALFIHGQNKKRAARMVKPCTVCSVSRPAAPVFAPRSAGAVVDDDDGHRLHLRYYGNRED